MILANCAVLIVMIVNQVTNYLPFRYNLYEMIYEHDGITRK